MLAQAVDRPGMSARFAFIKEALGSWGREVWLLASRSKPKDAHTAREVMVAACATGASAEQ